MLSLQHADHELLSGIVCRNFGHLRIRDFGCKAAWCRKCFRQHPKDIFPVLDLKDLDSLLVDDNCMGVEDEGRFKVARIRDHLINPF